MTMNQEKILLLGASGFIGEKIRQKAKENQLDILEFDRFDSNMMEKITSYSPTTIINAAGSLGKSNFEDALDANFLHPIRILNHLNDNKPTNAGEIKWVQLASYFEMQIIYGRTDPYSTTKATFRNYIKLFSPADFKIIILYLPHIVGLEMRKDALFPALMQAKKESEFVLNTSGEQYLPVLHVDDCVSGVLSAINSAAGEYHLTPTWYGELIELLRLINHFYGLKISATPSLKSVDAEYPKLNFSNRVNNWDPKVGIEAILTEFMSGVAN